MPSGYPYSKSVRPELFDRVWGRPAEAGGAESPRFGYTAFTIDAYAGLIPGWECSLSRNGSCVISVVSYSSVRSSKVATVRLSYGLTGWYVNRW